MRLELIFSMRDIYINSNPNPLKKFTSSSISTEFTNSNPLKKFTSSSISTEFKDILPWMEHLSIDHEDHPNQHENSHKLCDERGHPVVNLMESQWTLRQQHDQNLPVEGKAIVEQILASEERNNSKRAGL